MNRRCGFGGLIVLFFSLCPAFLAAPRAFAGDAAVLLSSNIPAGTPISVDNIGKEGISLVCVFSAPGFEDFMRAASALEGEKKGPMSKAEDDEIQRMYTHDVIYQQPQIGLPCLVSHLPHFA